MKRRRLDALELCWDASALSFDPFEPVMPLELDHAHALSAPHARIDLVARAIALPAPDPRAAGAQPVLFHGTTDCYADAHGLVLWDGASLLRIDATGTHIDAAVHARSLEEPLLFGSVTVLMALLLALRHHGYFHLHAAAVQPGDGSTWLLPGETGAGKSTLTLALIEAGAALLSDDALLVCRGAQGAVEVVGWPRKLRLTEHTARAYPELRARLTALPQPSARQWELDPRTLPHTALVARALGPFTLLFPAPASANDSALESLANADALGRALHACAWVAADALPGQVEQLALLSALCDAAPCYALASGDRFVSAPRAAAAELKSLLNQARTSRVAPA